MLTAPPSTHPETGALSSTASPRSQTAHQPLEARTVLLLVAHGSAHTPPVPLPPAWQAGRESLLGRGGVQFGFPYTCSISCVGLNVLRNKMKTSASPQKCLYNLVGDGGRQSGGNAGTRRRGDHAVACTTCRARKQNQSLLASFFCVRLVDADKHTGTSQCGHSDRTPASGS